MNNTQDSAGSRLAPAAMSPRRQKHPAAVALGRLGGKAGKGKAKARTSEQARAAARARWATIRPTNREKKPYKK